MHKPAWFIVAEVAQVVQEVAFGQTLQFTGQAMQTLLAFSKYPEEQGAVVHKLAEF